MALVVAHKTLKSTSLGLGGKPYKVDDKGILSPQPSDEDRRQILLLRAFHLVDEAVLDGYHPGLTPKLPDVDTDPPLKSSVAEVMAITRALDGVESNEPGTRSSPDLPPLPDDPKPDSQYLDALSRDDLLEIARARGLHGLKGKTKAQLLSLVKGV